jgi:hypothetical protein
MVGICGKKPILILEDIKNIKVAQYWHKCQIWKIILKNLLNVTQLLKF